jgi:hypothetical protein
MNAEMAARELGSLSAADALSLVLLYERAGDEKFERAARRWIRRAQIEHRLRHQEVELLRAAMGALGTRAGARSGSNRCWRLVGSCDDRCRRSRRRLRFDA